MSFEPNKGTPYDQALIRLKREESARWWRAYRAKNRERINANNRAYKQRRRERAA